MVNITIWIKIGAKKLISPLKAQKWKKIDTDLPNKERNLNKPEVGRKSKNANKWHCKLENGLNYR